MTETAMYGREHSSQVTVVRRRRGQPTHRVVAVLDERAVGHEGMQVHEQDGLVCSGLSIFDEGFCRPAWVLGRFRDQHTIALPKKGKITRDLFVWGLATVPEDAFIELRLLHPDPKQIKITLIPALQDEGTPFVVFDGKTDPAAVGTTTVVIDKPILHPGDESLNGRWTLVVEDTKTGKAGQIDAWALRFSSRMD